MTGLILHDYWRSTASYRVRIAMELKGAAAERATHDLRLESHRAGDFVAMAPQGLVPVIETNDGILTQSLAILEWLEECFPEPPLLPAGATGRAVVRAMASIIACDIHPLNNLRVLNSLRADYSASQAQLDAWIAHWIHEGFHALEVLVEQHGGAFAYGDGPTFADCCLVPQVYSARRFGVELDAYPAILRVDERARELPAVAAAHPDLQPDADVAPRAR